MNAEELKIALNSFYENKDEIGITVYTIPKNTEGYEPKKLDIEGAASNDLKELFLNSLKDTISSNEDLSVLELSTSDERLDAIYIYDSEIPEQLSAMDTVLQQDNLELLDLNDFSLSDIGCLLIEIGNNERQMVLYKTMAAVNIFGRKSFFLKKEAHRLEQIKEEFLRVSAGFQLLKIEGELLVIDLKTIEQSFGFHEVIKKEAALGIAAIEALALVDNSEVLHELLDDVKYARRFTKIAKSSPVIKAGVSNENIINFCKEFPKLKGKIRFNEGGDKINLDTKVSKDLFIKLLMDDFLTSELTNYHYASVAKDSVDEENPD